MFPHQKALCKVLVTKYYEVLHKEAQGHSKLLQNSLFSSADVTNNTGPESSLQKAKQNLLRYFKDL